MAPIALCPDERCPNAGRACFAEETLLIEVAQGRGCAHQVLVATVDRNMSFRGLVDLAKLRWRIERDYHDLKQESPPL